MQRLVTYRDGSNWRPGVSIDDAVFDLESIGWNFDGREATIRSVLETGVEAGSTAIALAESALAAGSTDPISLDETLLGPPVPDPRKILCVGTNYRGHIEESGAPMPEYPVVFAKWDNAILGPTAPLELTGVNTQVDWEGELAVVIGRRCKEVTADEALGVVAGYCVFNDVSARDIQLRGGQWSLGKSVDGFAPFGPGITPSDLVSDPSGLELTTRLNGEVVQHGDTSELVFDVPQIIAYLTTFITLAPGDVIATGTPSGVGIFHDPPRFLSDGDVIEVEIERLGKISNPVVGPTEDR